MLKFIKALLPVVLLALGGFVFWVLNTVTPVTPKRPHIGRVPVVDVEVAVPESLRIPVYTRGLVSANAEIIVLAETGGRVKSVSANLRAGGRVKKDELLVELDDTAIHHDITRVRGRLASARQQFQAIKNEIAAEREIEGLNSPHAFLQNKLKQAQGQLEAAEAELKLARLQLEKTKVYAPFSGTVREHFVVVGQVIGPGVRLASLYDDGAKRVRLPLSDRQFRMVETEAIESAQKPRVMLRMRFGKAFFYWRGTLVSTEGGIDPRNRLMYVVAQIDGPLDPRASNMPDLWVGQLLEAEIQGRAYRDVVSLPRDVLRYGDFVWVVDQDRRLRKQPVSVIHKGKGVVYLGRGVKSGDLVVTTPMDLAIEGMKVSLAGEDTVDQRYTGHDDARHGNRVRSRDQVDGNRGAGTTSQEVAHVGGIDPNVRYQLEGSGTRKAGNVDQALDRGDGPSEVPIYSAPNMMKESFN
jgi:RND family efflux transporter MFP subunit